MNHLEQLGNQFSIQIPTDEEGYLGRECPQEECQGYFKITLGTGLKGVTACHCPYCGFTAEQSDFTTKEQIEYAKSIVINKVTGALIKDLKQLEFEHKPQGMFGIGISMKVTGRPQPISYYREKSLETEIICNACTLRYAIYGVFAFCPDCGAHNSQQILEKNLELAEKEIALAATVQPDMRDYLIADALENVVSAFDGFGREACRIHASYSANANKAKNISFQNLTGARDRVQELFSFDLASAFSTDEWELACRCFQKRHLLAHKMGVVDEAYIRTTSDPQATVGRKIQIDSDEVLALSQLIRKLGVHLSQQLQARKSVSLSAPPASAASTEPNT